MVCCYAIEDMIRTFALLPTDICHYFPPRYFTLIRFFDATRVIFADFATPAGAIASCLMPPKHFDIFRYAAAMPPRHAHAINER